MNEYQEIFTKAFLEKMTEKGIIRNDAQITLPIGELTIITRSDIQDFLNTQGLKRVSAEAELLHEFSMFVNAKYGE